MKKLALLLLVSALFSQPAVADELTAEKLKDIKSLMEIMGSEAIATRFAVANSQQIAQTLKSAKPEIADRALVVIEAEIKKTFAEKMAAPGGLMEQITASFDKSLTHKEIQELLAFYQTPLGKKAIQVVNDNMLLGQNLGHSLSTEVEKRAKAALKREGLFPPGQ